MKEVELEELGLKAQQIFEKLAAEDFDSVASEYGYALSFNKTPAEAIKADFISSLNDIESTTADLLLSETEIVFKEFSSGSDVQFDVLVELSAPIGNRGGMLIELIRNKDGSVYLEQISSYNT